MKEKYGQDILLIKSDYKQIKYEFNNILKYEIYMNMYKRVSESSWKSHILYSYIWISKNYALK